MVDFVAASYQKVVKPFLFKFDAEKVHQTISGIGELSSKITPVKSLANHYFNFQDPSLRSIVAGIEFTNPVGLAAGFDYEAKVVNFLPSLGFGFTTIGTITNHPYQGNPKPRLDRLPRSQSLMVNKGFKNPGSAAVIAKLSSSNQFSIPVGISLGQTNTSKLKNINQAIDDICQSFASFETSRLTHTHYELNISCPNLHHHLDFYQPQNISKLLSTLSWLKIKRPVFVKMPISLSAMDFLLLLKKISQFPLIHGIIVGNLQTNRRHPSLDPTEVARFSRGNFSGRPTWEQGNQLIGLAYQKYKNRFFIIGCGGIFSAQDAYAKIKVGASLVQLITGLIFQGPQLVSQINHGLVDLLLGDGFESISEAVGTSKIKT